MDSSNPFFLNIAETLVSELQNDKEQSVAKLWMEKLQELEDKQLQLQCMKLFIFSLQTNIFNTPLGQSVPENPKKMMEMLENASKVFKSKKNDEENSQEQLGRVYTATSGDLHEYFAVQVIDDTFIHGYYGISTDEPMFKNVREITDFDMILNDEKFIINEIDDFLTEDMTEIEDDKVKDLCQCKNNAKNKVSIDSRPCWGRNRYIERLIDQSPHTVGDLEVTEVDAMLHNFRNRRQKS